jgi:methionyl-tRNA formyltransferase
MKKRIEKILLLTNDQCDGFKHAVSFCRQHFSDMTVCIGSWGDPIPEEMKNWEGDYIVSFLSRWIVPEKVLKSAAMASINFHPAPPEYPGVGCYNFALYNEDATYGVTCHHMAPKVDSGNIIDVMRFPLFSLRPQSPHQDS